MKRDIPVDRLVCGDVGFGRTGMTIRAVFKAVANNRQVAILVPTTVLAYQHFQAFRGRLKRLSCRVECLSRTHTATQAKAVIKGLETGDVDILIGTHRTLGKDVKFRDLSLLIIDREQKPGVSVKEKLRQMKANVDMLTMAVTPIPHTLQFSLIGARDLSVISIPPPSRYPIQTEVRTLSKEVITDTINFGMNRNGQVFLVNNRIVNLPEFRAMILRRIPSCRTVIGYGQMEPVELEQIIFGFVNYDYNVLTTTTITEGGIDIPNVNAIIINQAQSFGLNDLHRMRGRVGRNSKKAFCYLLAPPLLSSTPETRRHLQAIENFSDLGSGIHTTIQDLDTHGIGGTLRAEQSGFITDLGYETHWKILSEAVHEPKTDEFAGFYADELKGEGIISGEEFVEECQVEGDLELLLPVNYAAGSSERMLLYRELDGSTLDKDVDAFRLRLKDRFGPVPPEAEELLHIVPLRHLAACLGVKRVFLRGGHMTLFFAGNPDSPYYQSATFGKMIDHAVKYTCRYGLREQNGRRSVLVKDIPSVETAVSMLQEMVVLLVKERGWIAHLGGHRVYTEDKFYLQTTKLPCLLRPPERIKHELSSSIQLVHQVCPSDAAQLIGDAPSLLRFILKEELSLGQFFPLGFGTEYRLERVWTEVGVLGFGSYSHRGGSEILHLSQMKIPPFGNYYQPCHILLSTSGMAGDEIGN